MARKTSGAQYRRDRVARGLPARTPNEKPSRGPRPDYSAKAAAIKLERGCTDCGYRGHPDALEFDHLPGVVKVGNVSALIRLGYSWAKIEAEIAKCEVVCANCHRIRTRTRLG